MNREAKQMILCAAVDGTISELPQMMECYNPNMANCRHFPEVISEHRNYIGVSGELYTILLREVSAFYEPIGTVERCKCGKIYYSIRE